MADADSRGRHPLRARGWVKGDSGLTLTAVRAAGVCMITFLTSLFPLV